MRLTSTAIAAASAILVSFLQISGSVAQNAPYGAAPNTMPVPNGRVNGAYPQNGASVPNAAPAQNGVYAPNGTRLPPQTNMAPALPPANQQQAYQSGQTYQPAQGYASEKLSGADGDGFSPEEIKGAGHRFFGKVSSGFASAVEYTFQRSGRPNGYITGLSKIARVVDAFARRLQVQERLTVQIRDCIHNTLKPMGVAVVIEALHLCMAMRGIQKQNSVTTTSAFTGCFLKDYRTREEFIHLIGTKLH